MNIAVSVFIMIFIKIHAMDTTEEDPDSNPYNTYSPSTSNLQELYTNTFSRNNEESTANDDYFVLSNVHTVSAEFHPAVLKITRMTPAPSIVLSPTLKQITVKSTTENNIIDDPEFLKNMPSKNKQIGVLDILFPPTRVKSFKNIFDSVRRILSYTFRK